MRETVELLIKPKPPRLLFMLNDVALKLELPTADALRTTSDGRRLERAVVSLKLNAELSESARTAIVVATDDDRQFDVVQVATCETNDLVVTMGIAISTVTLLAAFGVAGVSN